VEALKRLLGNAASKRGREMVDNRSGMPFDVSRLHARYNGGQRGLLAAERPARNPVNPFTAGSEG